MPCNTNDLLICDLTQSYAPRGGGGVSTYLKEKRRHVLSRTSHRLLQIVPGPVDRVVENGRHIWVEIGAEQVRGSPNYRFILRNGAVRDDAQLRIALDVSTADGLPEEASAMMRSPGCV